MVRVVLTQPIDRAGIDRLVDAGLDVVVAPAPTREEILARVADADALVVRAGPCTREVIDAAPRLRVIGKHGVGLDNIDVEAATERRIPVFYTADAATETVAEMALAMLMALTRRLLLAHRLVEENRFHDARWLCQGIELRGKTLGLVGLGRIGSRLATVCQAAFDMRVLAFDPYLTAAQPVGVETAQSLAEVLGAADVLSIHCPLTDETRGLIGAAQLAAMKPGAYLVNTARGAIVDEQALADALRAGHLAGAAIDAFA
jgi:D-3-phosphoglycerate dehydrogenase